MDAQNTIENFRPLTELVPTHWKSGFVEASDGTCIHYTRTGGAKPAVVLLHGVQVDGLSWLRTAKALEATYDVIMPDSRGHGKTSLEKGLVNDTLVNDILTVINALGLEKPFVVGHSMGADVAGRLAAVHSVRALVFVDPALQNFAASAAMDMDNPPPWMQALFDTMNTLKTQSHAERMKLGQNIMMPGSTTVWNESDYVSYIDGLAKFDLNFYRYALQGKGSYLFDEPQVIASIDCPILLLTARPMMPGANHEAGLNAFTQNWRQGQHIHFPDSGHAIMFDQFERFIEVLTEFFAAH